METTARTDPPSPPFVFSPPEAAVLRERPRIAIHDWARSRLRLVSGPYKGHLWNPDVAPFARDIMRAFDRRHTRKIFLVQPSQTTKSTVALCCFLAALLRMPDNMGIGMPDQEAVRKYMTGRMAAYFSGIPELRALLRNGAESLRNHGIDLRGGASVLGMWSGSDSTMRAESMPYVLIEEEDATVLAFHIRQWESPLVSLSDILARWWESQGNPRALQLWDNNVCAQPYRFIQLETDHDALKKRVVPDLPANALPDWPGVALTLSIDMQMDYFVYSVAAHWVEPRRLHVVDYGMVKSFTDL